MQVRVFELESNCNVLYDPEAGEAVVIDCGKASDDLSSFLKESGLRVKYFLATHGHYDHVYGFVELQKYHGDTPLYMHSYDEERLRDNGALSMRLQKMPPPAGYDEFIQTVYRLGDAPLTIGGRQIQYLPTPGHTAGSVLYYLDQPDGLIFSGDTIFPMRTGMTSFKSGSKEAMLQSLRAIEGAFVGRGFTVYPGHYNQFQLDERFAEIYENVK